MSRKSALKKSFATLACMAFMVSGVSILASAATSGPISAHTISPGTKMEYWNGTNGMDIAAGGAIDLSMSLRQDYTTDSGWRNVGGASSTVHSGYHGSSVSMYSRVPSTGLYRAWVKNDSDATIYVLSGTLSST